MTAYSEGRILKTLVSMERTFNILNRKISEALTKLDEATVRISALGEIHLKLAKTITGILGVPQDIGSSLDYLLGPMVAISSSQRAESMAAGLLTPIVRNLGKPCRNIAQAINTSKVDIMRLTRDFDFAEMEIVAEEFCRDPDRVLDPEQQETLRNKIREWTLRLKNAFSG
jgi:hypothetical protein